MLGRLSLGVAPRGQVRWATKLAGGSTKNKKDSAGRRLGLKLNQMQGAKKGSILVRQRGRKYIPGENVGIGKDHTLYSKIDGVVKYEQVLHEKKAYDQRAKKAHLSTYRTHVHVVPRQAPLCETLEW